MFRIPFLFLYEVYSITLVILNEAGHLSNNDRHGLIMSKRHFHWPTYYWRQFQNFILTFKERLINYICYFNQNLNHVL